MTTADGSYGMVVSEGSYTLTVQAPGYGPVVLPAVTVSAWQVVAGQDAELTPTDLLPGDANTDGWVDEEDLAVWQEHYDPLGVDSHRFATGDWNGDGRVNGADLALWQQNYVPEE